MKNTELAERLRKVASEMRKQAEESETRKMHKCAQVLVAARGLAKLRELVKGAEQ